MPFPGNFDIQYYRGDTYEFKIYPKDSNGAPFSLLGYDLNDGVKFTIAPVRGVAGLPDQIVAFARISPGRDFITCAILPNDGIEMNRTDPYFYDVEISKSGELYPLVTTLLTGQIRVTEQVSGATEDES